MSWADRTGAAVLAALALFMVATAIWLGIVGWSATPLGDQWDHLAPEQLAGHLLAPHNEHRIVVSRLTFWLDVMFGKDTGVIPTVFVYLFNFGHWALLVFFAKRTWPDASPLRLLASASAALIFFASGFQFENFANGFQNQFPGVFFFGTSAVIALVQSAGRPLRWRLVFLALTAFCAILSVASMANGLLLVALLPLVALALGMWATAAGFSLLAVACWLLYFAGLPAGASHPLARILADPLSLPRDAFAYLGGAIPNSIALMLEPLPSKVLVAQVFGAVAAVACAAIVAAAVVARRRKHEGFQQYIAWAAIVLFLLGTSLLTAVGRGGSWEFAMLSNRYGAATACVWGTLSFWGIMPWRFWRALAGISAVILAGTVLASAQLPWIAGAQGFKFIKKDTEAAILAGADAKDIFRRNYPDPERVPAVARSLREQSLAMFAEPWARLNGGVLAARGEDICAIKIESVNSYSGASTPTWSAAATGDAPSGTRGLAAVDTTGHVIGLLIRGTTGDLASMPFGGRGSQPKWSGFVRPGPSDNEAQDLEFWAVDKQGRGLCKLRDKITLDRLGIAKAAPVASVGAALSRSLEVSSTGVFPEDGVHETRRQAPFAGRVWGSFAGTDGNQGSFTLRAAIVGETRIAIPLVTGPGPKNTRVEVLIDGRMTTRLQDPGGFEEWGAFEVDVPPHAVELELRAYDESSDWGGWIAVGEPHNVCNGDCAELARCPTLIEVDALKRSGLGGMIDSVTVEGDYLVIAGWAADLESGRASRQIVGVIGGSAVLCTKPDKVREDVAKARGDQGLSLSGFTLRLPTKSIEGVEILSRQEDGRLASLGALAEAATASR